jgi:hypothetical protein
MVEIGLLLLILAIVVGIVVLMKSIKQFILNALIGLAVLFIVNTVAGLGIAYNWLVILICALGGFLGAVIIIILRLLGIAF